MSEKSYPTCPFCEVQMTPAILSGYYGPDNEVFWECACTPESIKETAPKDNSGSSTVERYHFGP